MVEPELLLVLLNVLCEEAQSMGHDVLLFNVLVHNLEHVVALNLRLGLV